jgi:competence protein ComEA
MESYITTSSGVISDNTKSSNTQDVKVNINTATQTQLETLSGIGPSIAAKIIAYRQENGKFQKIEDIKEVSGIGDSKFEKIKDYIVVK